MTEQEAAERLCALLNEIEAAGHGVGIQPNFGSGYHLTVGEDAAVYEPRFDDAAWEVES